MLRTQQLCHSAPPYVAAQAMLQYIVEVRPPATEIVVRVNRGDASRAYGLFHALDAAGSGESVPKKIFAASKFEVIDNVDKKQNSTRGIRHMVFRAGRASHRPPQRRRRAAP